MVRERGFSGQTLSVLAVLCARPEQWHHGYDLARETGLKSGTLYPILIRLADRELLEACWEDEQPAGRPRRHLYRLTSEGLARAGAALAQAPAPARTARKAPAPARPGRNPAPGQIGTGGAAMSRPDRAITAVPRCPVRAARQGTP